MEAAEASSRNRVAPAGRLVKEAQEKKGIEDFSELVAAKPKGAVVGGTEKKGEKFRSTRSALSSRRERFSMVFRMPMKP